MAEYHYECELCDALLKFSSSQEAPFDYQHFYSKHGKKFSKEELRFCNGKFFRVWKPTTVVIKDYKKESIYKK